MRQRKKKEIESECGKEIMRVRMCERERAKIFAI